jgi:hypothetical protein
VLRLALADPRDAGHIVDALLTAAELERTRRPLLARRYVTIADSMGDALDQLPGTTDTLPGP